MEITTGPQTLSPTDVSQFIRLDQCQMYLKLRLRERSEGQKFLRDYGVAPQAIPPILTKSGASFEAMVEAQVSARYSVLKLTAEDRRSRRLTHDNQVIIETIQALGSGVISVLFQPRIDAMVHGWRLRGDIDILRIQRDDHGSLSFLVADMKSSTSSKVEHRLQVAFYHEMLGSILADAGIVQGPIELAILYRGPSDKGLGLSPEERIVLLQRGFDAAQMFGTEGAYLERITDADAYLGAVGDLVTNASSTAHRIIATNEDEVPYHLNYKCDGCLYNEFCMKRSAERDDLSLLAHVSEQDKRALHRTGITNVNELATLKEWTGEHLTSPPATRSLNRQLAATWPVGPRMDELIHRARRYRRHVGDDIASISWIPNKGYGSLPFSSAEQNPNLVRVYIDAQQDFLQDRVYLLGALVVGCEDGFESVERRRSIVRLADGPPDTLAKEASLFLDWISATLQAIVEVATPDETGERKAPIHLIFHNSFAQRTLLEGLARNSATVLGATAIYDFVTQVAGLDSSLASYLDEEIRSLKNYPMTCQSLQSVAAYLKFDWNEGTPYREIFRSRLFDFWSKFDEPVESHGRSQWYMGRSRFSSQIPLEFAYSGWGELPIPEIGADEFGSYRGATSELLIGFETRRLEAMEHIAHDFRGNDKTAQTSFILPDLANFEQRAHNLAQALDEFMMIERHVDLSAWKRIRLASPEDRVLTGETLVVRYVESDQYPGVDDQNRDNAERNELHQRYRAEYRESHPDAKSVRLSAEQKSDSAWSHDDMIYRLRIETTDVACDLSQILRLTNLKPQSWTILSPRTSTWEPNGVPVSFTPTAKNLLYNPRVSIEDIGKADDSGTALVDVSVIGGYGSDKRGFRFGRNGTAEPFIPDKLYTLDSDPNDSNGGNIINVTGGLVDGGAHRLYELLTADNPYPAAWPEAATAGQARFLQGLDALTEAGAFHSLESSKRSYIGDLGGEATLLVQGPPGTGKSYSTSLAVLSRMQGAMAAEIEFRVVLSSKTHAAIDVLLNNVHEARALLSRVKSTHPSIFAEYFDPRLLDITLARMTPRGELPDDIVPLYRDRSLAKGAAKAIASISAWQWCVVGSTPSGIYGMIKDRWPKDLFGNTFIDCVVLDEASQMSLPEAMAATLGLRPTGRVIVVGDHRQMPPIVKNDWSGEPRRTFKEFQAYASLFDALRAKHPTMIKFEESFRLHHDMAEFLGQEIYNHDGIRFHSHRDEVIHHHEHGDRFVDAVLMPEHPLTVVLHDESLSLKRNEFEQELMRPILEALAHPELHNLSALEGLGVVVPHTAQRAGLLESIDCLTEYDPATGEMITTAVDTVERYQGDERSVIVISATESDREYLLVSGKFLLDPRRLTVALSRAKRKLILVAARSIFEVISGDEETFANAQLWKNLLRKTCTVPLWEGKREGIAVEVWGNRSDKVL